MRQLAPAAPVVTTSAVHTVTLVNVQPPLVAAAPVTLQLMAPVGVANTVVIPGP